MVLRPPSLDATLRTSVCVVGSGPAGITCAMELAKRHIDVLLVESGVENFHGESQAMCDAEIVDNRRHAPMQDAVRRAFGGTSWLWGGRCIPFDPIDFEPRDYAPGTAWPISYETLLPYYAKACEYANCGKPAFTVDRLDAETSPRASSRAT
ncbi:Choline dehydrogenase and related flavoproteins [Cupriavidus gilardii J11]|uniref:Choline dehydrogenase and related flavoproteins n=1 Tax=Cupriavidus gilardii J11 TaxID=936133 RepID=A0A562B594_9BURK|nr:FAD-dependent oxidoreductase [Cupriavidus gilardii]TWG80395.1 Choline dehydrogenase and related flavoproteins [Cupriavidus gilardii J11]